jgi:PAS domain S-box-containing protein
MSVSDGADASRLPRTRGPIRILWALGGVALYWLAARLGLLLAFEYTNVSPVWPPSGLALAILVLAGKRAWPVVTAGAFLANFTTGIPVAAASLIAVGNTLEALCAASILSRPVRFQPALRRQRDVALLVAAGVIGATIAASIGVAGLALSGLEPWSRYGPAWLTWWLGDTMGVVVVGSAILTWCSPSQPFPARLTAGYLTRLLEAVGLTALLPLSTAFVFGRRGVYPYVVFPVLVCAALRFGQRAVTASIAVLTGLAVWATIGGSGPFARLDSQTSLVLLQSFMAVAALTPLVLGAAISERADAEEALRCAEERFRLALQNSDISVYSQDRGLRYTWIYDGKHRFDPAQVVGRTDSELAPADQAEVLNEIKRRVLDTGVGERREVVATTQGETSIYDLAVEPLRDTAGKVIGVSGVAHDVTRIKRYQEDVEALNDRLRHAMRETHHRVKNNLQVIAAMVDMRLMDGGENVPAAEVKRLATVTTTLATVHDLLTHEASGDSAATTVSAKAVIAELAPMLQSTALGRTLEFDTEDMRLPSKQATSLAIVICELVANAVKHGRGRIRVEFHQEGAGGLLRVTDDGNGFRETFDISRSAGTGLDLVQHLSRLDLGGDIRCFNLDSGGACVAVRLCLPATAHDNLETAAAEREANSYQT